MKQKKSTHCESILQLGLIFARNKSQNLYSKRFVFANKNKVALLEIWVIKTCSSCSIRLKAEYKLFCVWQLMEKCVI